VGPATAGTACTAATEEDRFLIIGVRVPNGLLTAEQVEAVGCISQRFGRDARDVTDRQNLPAPLDPHRGRLPDLAGLVVPGGFSDGTGEGRVVVCDVSDDSAATPSLEMTGA
jgi:phosphoribosylformylglycinamidine (FGAM) synthase-like amidotransferase family enzyme